MKTSPHDALERAEKIGDLAPFLALRVQLAALSQHEAVSSARQADCVGLLGLLDGIEPMIRDHLRQVGQRVIDDTKRSIGKHLEDVDRTRRAVVYCGRADGLSYATIGNLLSISVTRVRQIDRQIERRIFFLADLRIGRNGVRDRIVATTF